MGTCVPAPIGPADTAAQLVGHEFTKLVLRALRGVSRRPAALPDKGSGEHRRGDGGATKSLRGRLTSTAIASSSRPDIGVGRSFLGISGHLAEGVSRRRSSCAFKPSHSHADVMFRIVGKKRECLQVVTL
jgi:hypothetical protein